MRWPVELLLNSLTIQYNKSIEALKQAFLDKKYDLQLVQQVTNPDQTKGIWTWTPIWQSAIQRRTSAATYTYIPLEAYLEQRPYVVTLVGCRRYLLIKSTGSDLSFSTILYTYREPRLKSPDSFNLADLPYFINFTGVTLVKDMASGQQSCFFYEGGVRQEGANGQKTQTGKSASKTSNCITTYICEWTGYCYGGGATWQVYTGGTDYCHEPDSGGICYLSIDWHQTGSWTHVTCDDGGDGSGSGDDGGNGNTGPCPSCSGGVGTPPNPNSPCGQMATLAAKAGMQNANSTMIGLAASSPVEQGAVFRNGGNAVSDFVPFSAGTANDADWPRAQGWQYDGMMHTHPGGLSVFSMSDISQIYQIADEGYMHDPATFAMMVYTSYGEDYALKITNYNQFLNFKAKMVDDFSVGIFEDKYILSNPPFYPFVHSSSLLNEQSLLRILKDFDTGLTLLKHDRTSNTWQQRGLSANKRP